MEEQFTKNELQTLCVICSLRIIDTIQEIQELDIEKDFDKISNLQKIKANTQKILHKVQKLYRLS